MANTTWSPSDKTAGITLSGGNLVATVAGFAVNSLRAAHTQTSGKYYWEITCNPYLLSLIGMAPSTRAHPFSLQTAAGACGLDTDGGIYVNNAGALVIGDIPNGAVVGIAVDLDAHLIWFRKTAAGNWNNSGTANPATGVGGVSIPGLGGSVAASPAFSSQIDADKVTANFGDSAFAGAVPSGFTSGFPTLPPAPAGRAKVWTGSAWAVKPVKVWSGSAWVEKPLKVWNGSSWV